MVKERRFGKIQTVALVVIAAVMGANLISPAVAHVTRSLKHLTKHLDKRYVKIGTTVPNATNAANLGGTPASGYLQTADVRVDGNVSDVYIDNFTSGTFTPLISKSFTAPSNGFLFIVGSVSFEDDSSFAGAAALMYRLRLDATPTTNDPFAYVEVSDSANGDFQVAGSASAVVPVTAGAHTVHLDGLEVGTGSFIIGRDISVMFSKSGSGVTIPVRQSSAPRNP